MHYVTIGVPQGAILAPTLFNIYVNDLTSAFASGTLCQYADDTSLIVAADSMVSVAEQCKTAISNMSDWCIENRLQLNGKKTALLQFCNSAISRSIYVNYNGKSIPTDSVVDFLGLSVDVHLNWEAHSNKLISKLASALFGMRSLREAVSMDSLKLFYFAYVESRIRYGIIFWGGSAHAERIFKMQKKILRCMFNKPQTASCRPLFIDLNIMTLAALYIYELIMHCIKNNDAYGRNCDISTSMRTRGSENLTIPIHRTQLFESGPHYKAILCYNKLPTEIKELRGRSHFKSALKSFLIRKSFYSLTDFLNM